MAKAIMPSELQERLGRGERLRLIDVRTPAEFRSGYLHGATNVPLDRIDYRRWVDDRRTDPRPIVLLCERGSRAAQAGEALSKAGRDDAIVVEGGTRACDEAGLTIVRGRRAISMERQVRIAAGSLVLGGIGLWLTGFTIGLGLSAFVGAGLVFAGVSNTCGMALVLARMPWNR